MALVKMKLKKLSKKVINRLGYRITRIDEVNRKSEKVRETKDKASGNRPVYFRALALFGEEVFNGSMIGHEEMIRKLIDFLQPNVVLEIGTLSGLSTALWADTVEKVYTLDISVKNDLINVWNSLGVSDRIIFIRIPSNAEKREIIKKIDYDFVFIDGDHSREGVALDFDIVKEDASYVLFHDYKPEGGLYKDCGNKRMPGIVKFIDSIPSNKFIFGPKCSKFALWINAKKVNNKSIDDICSFVMDINKEYHDR